jgi:hypothetical protein
MNAVDGLFRFKGELKIRERRYELYRDGEEIFAFEHKGYPEFERPEKDTMIASQLLDLCVDAIRTISDWKLMPWVLSQLERAFQQ